MYNSSFLFVSIISGTRIVKKRILNWPPGTKHPCRFDKVDFHEVSVPHKHKGAKMNRAIFDYSFRTPTKWLSASLSLHNAVVDIYCCKRRMIIFGVSRFLI